jgi:hypothetical protein
MLADGEGVPQSNSVAHDDTLEVAGYRLSPAVALGMQGAELNLPPACAQVVWCEVSLGPEQHLLPASQRHIARWRERGSVIRERAVSGPPFWQTVEVSQCEALLEATLELTCQ